MLPEWQEFICKNCLKAPDLSDAPDYSITFDEKHKYFMLLENMLIIDSKNNKNIDQIICKICMGIARDPVECIKCDSISCSKCLTKWLEINASCINCKMQSEIKKLNRHVL